MRLTTLALVASLLASVVLVPSPAAAQALDDEELAIDGASHQATALYVSSVSLLSSAALAGLYAGVRSSGDVVEIDMMFSYVATPVLAGVGVVLLALGATVDVGSGAWRGARAARFAVTSTDERRALRDREQLATSHAIIALYVIGASALATAAASAVVVAQVALWQGGWFVGSGVTGGLGAIAMLCGATLDVLAGAWSGAPALSIGASHEGASLALRGAF